MYGGTIDNGTTVFAFKRLGNITERSRLESPYTPMVLRLKPIGLREIGFGPKDRQGPSASHGRPVFHDEWLYFGLINPGARLRVVSSPYRLFFY